MASIEDLSPKEAFEMPKESTEKKGVDFDVISAILSVEIEYGLGVTRNHLNKTSQGENASSCDAVSKATGISYEDIILMLKQHGIIKTHQWGQTICHQV